MEQKAEGWDVGPVAFVLGSGSALCAHSQVNICPHCPYLANPFLLGLLETAKGLLIAPILSICALALLLLVL